VIKTLSSTIAYQDAWMAVRRGRGRVRRRHRGRYSVLDRDDFADVEQMIRDGVITDGPSVAAYPLLTLQRPIRR